MPLPAAMPSPSAGIPPPPASNSSAGKQEPQQERAGHRAPASSAAIETPARGVGSLPVTHSEIATAGFTIPPEMCAVIETMIGEHEPVRERDPGQVELPVRVEDHRAGPDEDERERRDELRDGRLPDALQRSLHRESEAGASEPLRSPRSRPDASVVSRRRVGQRRPSSSKDAPETR